MNTVSDSAVYHEASYNDKNRAPASLSPKVLSSEGAEILDPVYVRTQADYHYAMGEAYSLDGKAEKAVESFKMVKVYDPTSALIPQRLAAEYVKLGMLTEALELAEESVQKDDKLVSAKLLLGGLYSSFKQYNKAIQQYEKILKIEPDNTEAPLYLGAVFAEQKQYEKSIKYFESLAKNEDFKSQHMAYYYIGRVRMDQNSKASLKAAEAAFKKAIELKPSHADVALSLANLYLKLNQEDKAIELLKKFQIEQGPNSRVAETLAQLFMEKEDYDSAYSQLEILESSDEGLNIKVKMALILIEQKKYKPAVKKLEEILAQVPESDKILFYLAAVYEEINNYDKAIDYFTKIPSTSQFYGEAVVHATYLLKSQKRIDEALSIAKSAYEQRKDNPQIYTVYASMLDESKDYKTASEILSEGIKNYPDHVQMKFFMGTIHDRLGNKEQVIYYMREVLSLDPDHIQGLNYLAYTFADENKNLDEAEQLARKALSLDPKDGYILDTLGWVLFKKGQVQDSIKILEAAHKVQPNESIIAEHLGDAYYKQQLIDKAKIMYKKAAENETDHKKIKDIRAKIFALEKQDTNRSPASVGP